MSHSPDFDVVADGLHMPECPRWHHGHLWFSDIRGHLVCRIDDNRTTVVHRFPDEEEPAGLGWLPNGDLLVAGMTGRAIYRVSGGSAAVHADAKPLAPHQINDMIVTSDGTAFITQLGFDLDAPAAKLSVRTNAAPTTTFSSGWMPWPLLCRPSSGSPPATGWRSRWPTAQNG
jgi:sugar lactone lactonase YvrE